MVQIALFVAAAVSFIFAVIIFINDTKSTLFRLYFLFGVLSTIWMTVNALVIVEPLGLSQETRLHFAHLITPAAIATSLSFYLLIRYFTNKNLGNTAILLTAASLAVSAFSFTDLNVYLNANGEIVTGQLYPYYLTVVIVNILFVLYALFMKRSVNNNIRMQIRYLRLGAITAAVPTILVGAVLPIFGAVELSNIGPLFSMAFIFFAGIAIVRHHLFDIKLAAVRTAAYTLSILLLALIYFLLAYIVSVTLFGGEMSSDVSLSPVNVAIALILALIFQPVKRFFDKITDSIFYRDAYNSDEFFAELGELLTTTTDLRGLLGRVSKRVASTLKVEQASFLLHYTNGIAHRMTTGTHQHVHLPQHDVKFLDEYFSKTGVVIVQTDLMFEKDPELWRMLKSHKLGLVMALRQADKVIGYLLLGHHLTGNFTKKDINVLTTISNELVIAIQNALSLYEVKELNATLQQRVDVATKELRSSNAQLKHLDEIKDEFMSMASHQLRTPLTSVKGYISMVLEGDAGNVTPQQQKLLMEAFKSSERMVGLIADFLNVSRLQTGKFIIEKSLFDMRETVEQEVSDLKMIADSHAMKLKLKITGKDFLVVADEQKVRQVIMNFIDNAIYYSHPDGTIVVNLERLKDQVVVTIVDTGIGVPEAEQSRLFHKFFRAKNARKQRPDGTGVGLYLARRVVSAHGGSIVFSSKEGKGSTFGFRLPVAPKK